MSTNPADQIPSRLSTEHSEEASDQSAPKWERQSKPCCRRAKTSRVLTQNSDTASSQEMTLINSGLTSIGDILLPRMGNR